MADRDLCPPWYHPLLLLLLASSSKAYSFEWIHTGGQKVFLSSPFASEVSHVSDHLDKSLTLNHTFDDLDLYKSANRTLHSSAFLQFERYSIMNVTTAADQDFLARDDTDCATSNPNALFTRQSNWPFPGPSLFHSNTDALAEHGVSEFFDFVSFDIKVLGPIHNAAYMTLNAWEVVDNAPVNYYSLSASWGVLHGFSRPTTLEPRRYIEGWGEHVNWIETEVRNVSPDDELGKGIPWDFCLDNIVLNFHEKSGHGGDVETFLQSFGASKKRSE